jgi:hypothetical protein
VRDLVINLLASAIAAAAAWSVQYLVRYRRTLRKRLFFGVSPGAEVMLFVAKHFSSPHPLSVHRNDVATLVELATTIRESGGLPAFVTSEEGRREAGRITEYCVGGPSGNPRSAAHLRVALPGVRFGPGELDPSLHLLIGDRTFRRSPGTEHFALLARVRPSASTAPVFILAGQTAVDNLGAARYLVANWKRLRKTYGNRDFCLVLRLREPSTFGADHVHLVADVSGPAFAPISGAPETDHDHVNEPETAVAPAAAVDPSHHD